MSASQPDDIKNTSNLNKTKLSTNLKNKIDEAMSSNNSDSQKAVDNFRESRMSEGINDINNYNKTRDERENK
uniref:hypothetical protein n=1 Tax=Pedobacter schmidteae TaxID=2201271 RepID=UPI000EB00AA4|nr:hypothetical protein [Pedobacter schmidteae]